MQEVFSNIIEELEIERTTANNTFVKYEMNVDLGRVFGLEKAIEIVKQEAEQYNNGWIPCSERLPEERDWYLAVFEGVDTGFIGIPYIAEYLMGDRTRYTTKDGWIIRNCTDIEGVSSEYYKNLKCVAWQPLPQPYQPKGEHVKKTNFDRCCESMEAMAQIIDIAKIGWTKEQIMEWLQKEECEAPE